MTHLTLARWLWASPNSLLGLLLGAGLLLCGGRARVVHGTLEFSLRRHPAQCGRLAQRMPYRAITLGHVIVAMTEAELDHHRAHEHVHVRQYERWGPAFLPAYALCGLWQWLRGREAYRDNPFEVQARSRAAQRRAMRQPGRSP